MVTMARIEPVTVGLLGHTLLNEVADDDEDYQVERLHARQLAATDSRASGCR